MKRREFLSLVGGGVLAWPFGARAQTAIPVIGYLSPRSGPAEAPLREPFLKSLEEAGFEVGRNIAIEYRHSSGRDDQLSELASELGAAPGDCARRHQLGFGAGGQGGDLDHSHRVGSGDDPVRLGLVASLNQPGGNATGTYVFTSRLGAKRLSLTRALLPKPPSSTATPLQVEEMLASSTHNRPATGCVSRRKRGRGGRSPPWRSKRSARCSTAQRRCFRSSMTGWSNWPRGMEFRPPTSGARRSSPED